MVVGPNITENIRKREAENRSRRKCEERGGQWDSTRGICILSEQQGPKKQTSSAELLAEGFKGSVVDKPLRGAVADGAVQRTRKPSSNPDQPEVFTDNETGQPSGITLPTGETFLGIGHRDVNKIAGKFQEQTALPEGTAPVGTARAQAEQQAALQSAIANIGQVGGLTPAQEAEINFAQAATAGAAGAIPGVVGGALGGATVGALGGPIGAIGGAAIGGVGTFIAGTIRNIQSQQRGELQAAKEELTSARTNMRQLAMMATRDPANADYYISLYNEQLTRVHQSRAQTAAETEGLLNSWIEDGRAELADYDVFLQEGGTADLYGQKLQVALATQQELSLTGDQLFLEEEIL